MRTTKIHSLHNDSNYPTNLSVSSWNIRSRDGLLGSKTDDKEFLSLLKKCDIFCLQETRKTVKIPNYLCYNKLRDNGTGGGVSIGIKRNLASGVSRLPTSDNDILAIKLKKEFFKTEEDIVIVTCYVPPSNSSYLKKQQNDPFENISNTINSFDFPHQIIICGDFNARTEKRSDQIQCTKIPGIEDDDRSVSSVTDRNNNDSKPNVNGSSFLDLVVESNLTILNGRTQGDLLGSFTFVNYCGASTIDYFAVSPKLFQATNYLKIEDLNEYSDHKQLCASFSIPMINNNESPNHSFTTAPMPYKWVKTQIPDFKEAQKHESIRNDISDALKSNSREKSISGDDMNKKTIKILLDIADRSLDKKKPPPKFKNKNDWFDHECRKEKRSLNKAFRNFNNNEYDPEIKQKLFNTKRSYSRLLKSKKRINFKKLNAEIEEGETKNINWKKFKKLKSSAAESTEYDNFDLHNFYVFFKQLYHDHHPLDENICNNLRTSLSETLEELPQYTDYNVLSDPFSIEELSTEIRKLKSGKSVSLDLISNDMLKNLDIDMRILILSTFNTCLEQGAYPWCSSTMTPIPKGGDKYNPDNYRAIALGSCLGKLFSNLLLGRIQSFRLANCPDPPNQLGFTKNAQTSDHIFSLKTIIERSTKKRGSRLYSCFVDYRKAFDSVARDALLFKLAKLGIRGKIFACLKHMYENSSTQIKLMNKLSEKINLKNGVEQGHPLSPELFKIFILDLSHQLNECTGNFPLLAGMPVNHLLWADDLVLLATDERSLQILLDILHQYCSKWGLEINTKKTKILIFNKAGRSIKPSSDFFIGDRLIDVTRSYCYLGIIFTPSGSFKTAINELRKKALRASFSLKRIISNEYISSTAIFKLFDALVSPILTYACQVLLPETNFVNAMTNTFTNGQNDTWQQSWLSKIASDPFEKIHLKFIKWVFGTHKKSSNIACWGDSGRKPLGCQMLKQTIKYYNRISEYHYLRTSTCNPPDTFVQRAYEEQRGNSLSWFNKIKKLIDSHGKQVISANGIPFISPSYAFNSSVTMFDSIWKSALHKSPKLDFYKTVKEKPTAEKYIKLLPLDLRRYISRIRISAHRLPIELGRYTAPHPTPRSDRTCPICIHEGILQLGDEHHFLFSCKVSKEFKHILNERNLILWQNHDSAALFNNDDCEDLFNFATFVKKSYKSYLVLSTTRRS